MAKRGRKQQEIPGTERPTHPVIEEKFEDYHSTIEKEVKIKAKKKEHHEALILAMKEAGVSEYTFIDGERKRTIKIDSTEKIKISTRSVTNDKVDADDADDDGDGN